MTTTNYGKAALSCEIQRVRNSKPGTRNDTLNRAAFSLGSLIPAHLDKDLVISGLTDAALITTPNAKDDDPLADHEIEATIASGTAAGMDQPRDVADGFTGAEDFREEIDRIAVAFDNTPMRGWEARRMKMLFPGILQIAYEAGGLRNLALSIVKVGIYAGTSNRALIGKGLGDLVDARWMTIRAPGGPGHATRYDLRLPPEMEPLHGQDAPTPPNPGKWCRPEPATVGHDAGRRGGLGPAGVRIWNHLAKHLHEWSQQAAVARALGIHPSTASRHLRADRPLVHLGLIERDDRGRVRALIAPNVSALDHAAHRRFTLGVRDRDRARLVRYFQAEGFLTDDLRWIDPTDGTPRGLAHWLIPENARERLQQANRPIPGKEIP